MIFWKLCLGCFEKLDVNVWVTFLDNLMEFWVTFGKFDAILSTLSDNLNQLTSLE